MVLSTQIHISTFIFKENKMYLGKLFIIFFYFVMCMFDHLVNLLPYPVMKKNLKNFLSFIYFFLGLAAPGLHCCVWAFSSCNEQGLPLLVALGFSLRWRFLLWSTVSSPAGFSTCDSWALESKFSSCGPWAQLPCSMGMWKPPRHGVEPLFPALAGMLSNTGPQGKPCLFAFILGKVF